MKKLNLRKKQNRGITLIALVITIIILLIIVGISIAMLRGNNSILQKTVQAKERNDYSSAYEMIKLKIQEANVEYEKICTLEELEKFLSKENEVEILVTQYNKIAKKVEGLEDYQIGELKNIVVNVLEYTKYYFLIGENCKITHVSNDYGNNFVDIKQFEITSEGKELNSDWKNIVILAGKDPSQFNNYDEVLNNNEVVEAILKSKDAIDYLINSNNELIDKSLDNEDFAKKLAKDEEIVKKIVANENWMNTLEKHENFNVFFENVDIQGVEELTAVDEENPYFTFIAKANHKYFIQCYGAQGGSSYGIAGGYGGYSHGIFKSNIDTILYIYKGGSGVGGISCATLEGGYNGGGAITEYWSDKNEQRATGGGATHIATQKGLLEELENNKSSIIMVAGGGGGSGTNPRVSNSYGIGGNGRRNKWR